MNASSPVLRVLVVADDPLARAGLATLLSQQPGCDVVGQAASRADLPAEVEAARPDVLLWDLGWDPAPGSERLAELADDLPPVAALLPGGDEPAEVRHAWESGARALLPREADGPRLLAALEAMVLDLLVLDPALAGDLLQPQQGLGPAADLMVEDLTPREMEVLQLLAEGLPNKAIARRLDVSEHTVKFHVNAILGKLGARSRTQAVVRATRLGLILL
jgi:DNA-binding NarL/FixJ family response regulator